MKYAYLLTALTALIVLAGCKATLDVRPSEFHSSKVFEREPNDNDYNADTLAGFPFYNVNGYCGGYRDSVDKFTFSIHHSGTVRIQLDIANSYHGDLDLALEDDLYEIDSSEGYGRYESIREYLTPGTYYISVYSAANDSGSSYEMSGSFTRGFSEANEVESTPPEARDFPLKRTDYVLSGKEPETIVDPS